MIMLAIVFTLVFAVNCILAYGYAEEEIEFYFSIDIDDEEYTSVSINDDLSLKQALSKDGLDVVVPYGFLSDFDGRKHSRTLHAEALVADSSNIEDVSLQNGPAYYVFDNYASYDQDFKTSDLKIDGEYHLYIDVVRSNGVIETYSFNFVEDEGDSLEITGLLFEYGDSDGIYHCQQVYLEEGVDYSKEGLYIMLPSYYDNAYGVSIDYYVAEGLVTDDIKDVYSISRGKASFTLTFKSANGKNVMSIPVTIEIDSDTTSTDLDEIYVNCYEYYGDGTYFDEYFYVDSQMLNTGSNEIYVEIPSTYSVYDKDNNYVKSINIEDVNNVDLDVTAAGSARIDCSYYLGGAYEKDYSKNAHWFLEENFNDVGKKNVSKSFTVFSGNMEESEKYTVYIVVSDCEGNHNFGNWMIVRGDECYKTRKCKECSYVETDSILEIENLSVSNNASSGKPKLTWDACDEASKYYVYRATSKNGEYNYIGSTTNNYYTNTSANAGQTYYYKVKAVDAYDYSGELSNSCYITCDLAQPSNVKVNTVVLSGKPKVTWDKVSGADKYYVYRAASKNGEYSYLGYTSGTSYVNQSAVAGKTYYYRVKAIDASNEYANSAYVTSSAITCDLAQPTNVKVNNVAPSGKPKVTWTAVSGASKYYVYRATSKDGTYSYLGSTANTHYTNTGAVAGNTYYYKVKAIHPTNEYAYSAQSNYCYTTCDLPAPTNVKITLSSSGKPKVTWTSVDGASKYYVYRATSKDGTYSYLGSTTNTNYTNTGAVSGKTYYYKVKAVHPTNEYAYSAQSSCVYITSK